MRVRLALTSLVLAMVAVPLTSARADTTTVLTTADQYAPSQVTIDPGDSVELVHADVRPHNIVSKQTRGGQLLFGSDTITAGQRALVRGVEKLTPGAYPFTCSVHPQMLGTLTVRGAGGNPLVSVPLPSIVPTPTSLTFFGDSLYVASYGGGLVQRLLVLPGGALAPGTPYVTGLTNPLGITFAPDGTLFASDSHAAGTGTVGRVTAFPPGGGAAGTAGKVVIDNLPNGRHNTNGLVVHKGRLYVANGNSTDDGVRGGAPEQPLSGTLLSVALGARNIDARKPGRAITVEAKGLRNAFDLAIRPGTDELWSASNGPDALDPFGEDLLHRLVIREPTIDFGFPGCVYAAGPAGPRVQANPAIEAGCRKHRAPEALLGLHTSANGLAFAPTTGGFAGELFIALYGSNSPSTSGHNVLRIPIVNGRAGAAEVVHRGPAPLDVAVGPLGVYVADFLTGQISVLIPVG